MSASPCGFVREPARDVPVIARPDVLVAGGGSAGLAAACAAARLGADTLLIDANGFLGGTLTGVTLGGFCGTHAIVDGDRLGRVVGGLYLEVEQRLASRDAILPPRRHGRIIGVPYESVSLKLVADEMMEAFGVRIMLHTMAVAVILDGPRVQSVLVENKSGRAAIVPRIVIDCTGDGDVAAHAGAEYQVGDGHGTQYGSTMFRLGGVDCERAGQLTRAQIRELLEHAVSEGYPLPRTATGVHLNPLDGVVHLNVTKLGDREGRPFNLVDAAQLTQAEREGRRQVQLYAEVFRKFVPGFERARVIDIGARVGVRETRLIRGEAVLEEAHVRECVKPDDRIACSAWPLENHGRGRATQWEFLPDREYYGIPWGCLVVKGRENLLVAGRNLSASHVAQASARVAATCFAMGEAAGTGAAMSLAFDGKPRGVAVRDLQACLERHGAILTPDLS
jgi:FAD-dependent oxidoreductase family protein